MFGSDVLDVAIGVIFVFLLVSIACSAIREGLESILKTRAAYLEHGIRELLGDRNASGLAQQLYSHPIISGLFTADYAASPTRNPLAWAFARGRNLPSYIPARNFALAILDLTARGPLDQDGTAPITTAQLRANVGTIPSPALRRVLLTALDTAGNDVERARSAIESWFDSAMERVSGWYKRTSQWILFAVGIVIAVSANVDTIEIARYLYGNKTAREVIVADAQVAAVDSSYRSGSYASSTHTLAAEGLPIGFSHITRQNWPGHLLGWFLTALAATMGAPFWFDFLNKAVSVRSTTKAPAASDAPAVAQPEPPSPTIGVPSPAFTTNALTTGVLTAATVNEDDCDGCDVEMNDFTRDEDLPEARGGVALS